MIRIDIEINNGHNIIDFHNINNYNWKIYVFALMDIPELYNMGRNNSFEYVKILEEDCFAIGTRRENNDMAELLLTPNNPLSERFIRPLEYTGRQNGTTTEVTDNRIMSRPEVQRMYETRYGVQGYDEGDSTADEPDNG